MATSAAEVIRPLRRVEYDQLVKLGAFEDCSNVCDFFISEKSDNITGQVLYLGGIT